MNWKDVSKAIGTAAPLLGTLIGGPIGGTIGTAISGILGVENKPDAVISALKADPQALVKLKQYEMLHTERLQQMQLDEISMRLKDTDSARNRQNKHEEATGGSDINLYVLAWMVVLGFFTVVGTTMFIPIPQESSNIVYMLLGILGAEFGAVMRYFFGSSEGSSIKTKIMAAYGRAKSAIKPATEEKY
ncbi:MAG: hypothetical protein GXP61_08000 [Epsilonproteobacteria bacterium]|nr:hypothetical protein [Campylobacterota bacterium]